MTQTPASTPDYRNAFKAPFVDDRNLVSVEVFTAFDEARNKALHEDVNDHIGAIIGGLQAVILELSRASAMQQAPTLPAGAVSTTEERLPTRLEAQAAAKVLLRCNGADLSAWTDDVWPDQSMDEALKMLAAPTDEQKKWPLGSFDTLTCPECGTDCDPKSVSVQNDKPTVAYACGGCGRSWRIGPSGDETHVRSRKS